jgi:hypothetical protein
MTLASEHPHKIPSKDIIYSHILQRNIVRMCSDMSVGTRASTCNEGRPKTAFYVSTSHNYLHIVLL